MKSSSYSRVIANHPQCAEIQYAGILAQGVFEQVATEIFDNGIKRIYEKKLTVVTDTFPTVNKKLFPTIQIDGELYTIQDHYQENKFLTVLAMQ